MFQASRLHRNSKILPSAIISDVKPAFYCWRVFLLCNMNNSNIAPMMNDSNHVPANYVYLTNDLSKFKTIKGNRPPNPQHIKRLAHSIETYGMLCNPILVNDKMEVIDGQHRLLAAKMVNSSIYYIIIAAGLTEVHALNLNQKNWSKKDFLDGYAELRIESYVKLKDFTKKFNDLTIGDCISLCSNTSHEPHRKVLKFDRGRIYKTAKVFDEGTWEGQDFELAENLAYKIRAIKPYYEGYNRSAFVRSMIGLFMYKQDFNFNEFLHKLKIQPMALKDCGTITAYRAMIEDIYNYRNRNKINLRFLD